MNFEEKERILKSVMEQIEPERTARKKAQMKKLTSVAAIVAVVLLLGACAVKVFYLDEKLAAAIGGSDPVMEKVMTPLEDSCEANGIRIEGKQAIGDGHRALIYFDVISLTDRTFKYGHAFEEYDVYFDNGLMLWGADVYPIGDISDDGKRMGMIVELENSNYMDSLEGTLTLTNLVQFAGSTNIIQEGKWEIDVAVNCDGVMKTFETDETLTVDGVVFDIGSVDISPIYFCLHELKVTDEGVIPDADWWMNDPITSVNVVMKNGDEVVIMDRHEPWISSDDGSQWAEIQGDPYSLIDVDKVAGLSFDGQFVELK